MAGRFQSPIWVVRPIRPWWADRRSKEVAVSGCGSAGVIHMGGEPAEAGPFGEARVKRRGGPQA